jgi:hypothetical protein
MDPLLTPIKGRSRALVREGWPRGRMGRRVRLSLSPTRTLVTPYCKRTRSGRRATRRPRVSPFACILPPFVLRLAPTHLGWDTRRQFTRRSRDPPGSKRRQIYTRKIPRKNLRRKKTASTVFGIRPIQSHREGQRWLPSRATLRAKVA